MQSTWKDKRGSQKYALITGATSGFGYEFSKLFAERGSMRNTGVDGDYEALRITFI